MDLSVLPNNNHPEKFLQLDVKTLPGRHGMLHVGVAALSGQRQWQNRVYSQQKDSRPVQVCSPSPEGSPVFVDRVLQKHITAVTHKSTIKTNPLYQDPRGGRGDSRGKRPKPSWTIQDFDRHSQRPNLGGYLKEEDPGDLGFWLEDLYTPGYDSLLKKAEAEQKRNKICKILTLVAVCLCAIIVIVTVPVLLVRSSG